MNLDILICNSLKSRFIGFMFEEKINKILCFPRCNSIHTFFMKCNIDIYMTDKFDNILYVFKDVSKNKIIGPKKGVSKVYEVPVGYDLEKRLKKNK